MIRFVYCCPVCPDVHSLHPPRFGRRDRADGDGAAAGDPPTAWTALAQQHVPVELKSGFDDVRSLCMSIPPFRTTAAARSKKFWPPPRRPASASSCLPSIRPITTTISRMVTRALRTGCSDSRRRTGGFLAYPTRSLKGEQTGLAGVCRPGACRRWTDIPLSSRRADGLEHRRSDGQRDLQHARGLHGGDEFISSLKTPIGLLALIPAVKQFPQETFAALAGLSGRYLKKFDELCQQAGTLASRLTTPTTIRPSAVA